MSRKKTGEKRSRLFGKPDALLLDEAAVPGAPSVLPSPEENPATWPKPRVVRGEDEEPASSPVSAPTPVASFMVPDADPFSLPEPEEESIAAAEADGENTLLDLDFARARQASGASVRLRLGGSVATMPPAPPEDAFYDPDLSNLVETIRTGPEPAAPPPPRPADDGWDAGGFDEDDEDDAVLPGRPGVAMIRVPPVRSGPPTNPRPVAPPQRPAAPAPPPARPASSVSAVLRGPTARPAEPPVRAPTPAAAGYNSRLADEGPAAAPMRPGVYAMAMPSAPAPRGTPNDNRGARPTEPRGGPVSTAPTVIAPALSARALAPAPEPARVRPPEATRPAAARAPAPPVAPGPAPTAPPLEPASSTRSLLVGTGIGFALAAIVGVMVVQRGNLALGNRPAASSAAPERSAAATSGAAEGAAPEGKAVAEDGAEPATVTDGDAAEAAKAEPAKADAAKADAPEGAKADATKADATKADAAKADAAKADAAKADAAKAATAKADAAKADAAKATSARTDTKTTADAARVSALTSGSSIETGYIRVVTDKKCLVIVDGKQRGYAPNLGAIELSVGMHPVRCVVAGSGMSRSSEVRVDAGALRAVEIRFGE